MDSAELRKLAEQIAIIANSIWDDKPYTDHLGTDYLKKHKDE